MKDKLETRLCSVCNKRKPLSDFYKSVLKRSKPTSKCQCKSCLLISNRKNSRKYYWNHHDKRRTENKWFLLKRKYKISKDDYNKVFKQQQGCCAICGKHQSELKQALSVDHNHSKDEIRGLLCSQCNFGLGNFKVDELDIALLQQAIKYLGSFKI